MEPIYVAIEIGGNILSRDDFSNIYDVIKQFPELKQNIGIEYITFPLSSSSRAIVWRNGHIREL